MFFVDSLDTSTEPENLTIEQEELGSGAYGSVHRGTYEGMPCAVKKYHALLLDNIETKWEKEYRTSYFENEVSILKGIDHPFIVQYFYHYEEWSNRRLQLLVMERLHGSLDDWLAAKKPLNKCNVLSNIASALEYIHDKGIVHGDVNHTNILLSEDASVAKLADFGCAQLLSNSKTICHGNPIFMPPLASVDTKCFNMEADSGYSVSGGIISENNELSPKIDIFSFGLVILTTYFGSVPNPDIMERTDGSQIIPETERRASLIKAVRPIMSADMYTFALNCVDTDANERPCAKNFPTSIDRKSYCILPGKEVLATPFEEQTTVAEEYAQQQLSGNQRFRFSLCSVQLIGASKARPFLVVNVAILSVCVYVMDRHDIFFWDS